MGSPRVRRFPFIISSEISVEKIIQSLSHRLDEFQAGKYLRMFQAGDHSKVFGHLSVFDGGDNRFLQLIRKRSQLFVAVQLALFLRAPVQAKIVATELVEVSLPSRWR